MLTFDELETMRTKLRNKYLMWLAIWSAVIIIVICSTHSLALSLIPTLLCFLITSLITRKQANKYNLAYKNYFVKKSLTKIFTNLSYSPEKGIPYSIIASTEMMYMGDRYKSNDLIAGQYKDIPFMQSDVHIEEKHTYTDSDGHRRTTYVTIFKGRWMIFDFNKTFKANVQVCQKGFGNNKVNTLFSKTKYQRVEMESRDFNKIFKVYAINPHDAFYILTPSLMEKIIRLDEINSGKLLLCFINNKLHVGIYNNKDSFEHGSIFSKLDENKTTASIQEDIKKITVFVDELELDNELFKRNI